ncbi:hypothetical protein ACHAW6_000739 [Cyclotella cf. meneghiniana]
MKPIKVLGAIDDVGDPRETVYEIGLVIKLGKNLNNRSRNHADYVDERGYDIVCYLTDFADRFPSLYHVCIGQLSPHISTEVDCESLFSQAGCMSHPRRAHTNIRTNEWLMIGKHCLQRIYCHVPAVSIWKCIRVIIGKRRIIVRITGSWKLKRRSGKKCFLVIARS